jgi:hypothetical protein
MGSLFAGREAVGPPGGEPWDRSEMAHGVLPPLAPRPLPVPLEGGAPAWCAGFPIWGGTLRSLSLGRRESRREMVHGVLPATAIAALGRPYDVPGRRVRREQSVQVHGVFCLGARVAQSPERTRTD